MTDPTIWIGKDGISNKFIHHVTMGLKARELIKLKIHRSALKESQVTQIAQSVAASTGSTIIEVIGHTFTLYKRKESELPKTLLKIRRTKIP